MLPEPVFFQTDETVILSEMIADYELRTGKKLSPAQAETLLINAFAYREKMTRIAGNEACKQMLLSFAVYPALDYLGELVSVQRLPASKAQCTIRFTMVAGHGDILIPEGIRVQSIDGKSVFVTLTSVQVLTADASVTVTAECVTEGKAGNDYAIGEVAIILDPQAFVETAANTDITNGGADQESDDNLRKRIRLAPSSFSVAGPEDAYIYFAKSAHPAIIDVAVTSPEPGDVVIYPLLEGGVAPSQEIIDAVLAKCNPEKVRPLNDIVSVLAPNNVSYALTVNITLLKGADQAAVVQQITDNLTAYTVKRKTKLGIDVTISQIIAEVMVFNVYNAAVVSPVADLPVALSEFATCTAITVNVTGESDE